VTATEALLAVSAAHAGFQLVVTVVVYPALADLTPDRWQPAHDAHSRRVTRLVAPLYAAVVAVCGWALVDGPLSAPVVVAVAGNAGALAATALVAGPTHGRLGREGKRPELVRRLLLADRVRTVAAVAAALTSVLAVASR
jgi:hypothetical protein